MLLAIDVGNTETVVGMFQGDKLTWHWRYSTVGARTADELALLLGGFLEQQGLSFSRQITGVALASVVPDQTQALRTMVRRYFHFPPVVVEPGTKTGIAILYDNPKDVGADRIANAVAAFTRYGGPAIVVDFGTATTFDVISADAEYLGGAGRAGPGHGLDGRRDGRTHRQGAGAAHGDRHGRPGRPGGGPVRLGGPPRAVAHPGGAAADLRTQPGPR